MDWNLYTCTHNCKYYTARASHKCMHLLCIYACIVHKWVSTIHILYVHICWYVMHVLHIVYP